MKRYSESMSNTFVERSLYAVLVMIICFFAYCLTRVTLSDGRIDYCYIDNIKGSTTGGYEIIGHRPWRPDAHLGVASGPEAANEVLKNSLACPK